jgi:hypothetical protein
MHALVHSCGLRGLDVTGQCEGTAVSVGVRRCGMVPDHGVCGKTCGTVTVGCVNGVVVGWMVWGYGQCCGLVGLRRCAIRLHRVPVSRHMAMVGALGRVR